MDCVNCLIRFANNKTSHRISLKAIALLRICEDRLAEVCFYSSASFINRVFFVIHCARNFCRLDYIFHLLLLYALSSTSFFNFFSPFLNLEMKNSRM